MTTDPHTLPPVDPEKLPAHEEQGLPDLSVGELRRRRPKPQPKSDGESHA